MDSTADFVNYIQIRLFYLFLQICAYLISSSFTLLLYPNRLWTIISHVVDMKRRAKQSTIDSSIKKKKKSEYPDDLIQSNSKDNKNNKNGNHEINKPKNSNGKVEKITTVVGDIPSFRICWAQIYSFPYWPCKILLPEEIPSHVVRKKKTKNTLCVLLYGKNECAWTSPSRIIDFEEYPDYPPDARKRPLSSLLIEAIESAKNDIHINHQLRQNFCPNNNELNGDSKKSIDVENEVNSTTIIDLESTQSIDQLDSTSEDSLENQEEFVEVTKGKIKTYFTPTQTTYSRYDRPSSKSHVDHIMLKIKNQKSILFEYQGFIGLLNLGNTCYINSALQCLHSLSQFSKTFIEYYKAIQNELEVNKSKENITTRSQRLSRQSLNENNDENENANLLQSFYTILEFLSNPHEILNLNNEKFSFHIANDTNESNEDVYIDPIGNDDDINIDCTDEQQFKKQIDYQDMISALLSFKESSGFSLDKKYLTDQLQDINEFITQLLEYIHQQSLKLKKKKSLKKDSLLSSSSYEQWRNYIQFNQSFIVNNFDGLLRRKRVCPNGHTSLSYEVFRTLTLHFDDFNERELSLGHMLMKFKSPEVIECRCSSCGGKDNKLFSQTTDVYLFPKYLILTLGRFQGCINSNGKMYSWWAHKIKTRVKFPTDNLDMTKYFDIGPDQMKPVYSLIAVSNHKGTSLHGGHYFSYIRASKKSSTWVLLNDNMIKTVHKDSIITNQAYMLFYERIT